VFEPRVEARRGVREGDAGVPRDLFEAEAVAAERRVGAGLVPAPQHERRRQQRDEKEGEQEAGDETLLHLYIGRRLSVRCGRFDTEGTGDTEDTEKKKVFLRVLRALRVLCVNAI
jgi:hypothetical protein